MGTLYIMVEGRANSATVLCRVNWSMGMIKKTLRTWAFTLMFSVVAAPVYALPNIISQVGYVVNGEGEPYDDVRLNIRVRFYEAAEGANPSTRKFTLRFRSFRVTTSSP